MQAKQIQILSKQAEFPQDNSSYTQIRDMLEAIWYCPSLKSFCGFGLLA